MIPHPTWKRKGSSLATIGAGITSPLDLRKDLGGSRLRQEEEDRGSHILVSIQAYLEYSDHSTMVESGI